MATCYTTNQNDASLSANYYLNIYDHSGNRVGVLTSWVSVTVKKELNTVFGYVAKFSIDSENTDTFYNDLFVVDYQVELIREVPGVGIAKYAEFIGFHRDSAFETDDMGVKYFTSIGVGLTDLLARTSIAYLAGTIYSDKSDEAETVMKQYAEENCGLSATYLNTRAADGTLPGFFVDTDTGQGIVWEGSQSFNNLHDVLVEISNVSKIDFDVITGASKAQFIFTTYPNQIGLNRTLTGVNSVTGKNSFGNVPILFKVERNNVSSINYEINRSGESNVVYVLGQGDGATRDVVIRTKPTASDDSPWNRREVSRPAGSQEFTYQLEDFGDSVLEELAMNESFSIVTLQQIGCQYGKDYSFGDKVSVAYSNIATANKRITGVTISIEDNAESIEIEMSDY